MAKRKIKVNTCIAGYTPQHTVTGRTGNPLWLTCPTPNAEKTVEKRKIGSEIQSKAVAPPGHKIVQFDFDSMELALFAAYGDSAAGAMGSTHLSYSLLAGNKADGTDYMSAMGKLSDITRKDSKTCVYASIYNCGKKKLGRTLWASNKGKPIAKCESDADRFLLRMKGKRARGSKMWQGGSASASYNKITEIIYRDVPREPVLNRAMSTASRPSVVGNDFIAARSNAPVQGAGASLLYITITMIEWLRKRYDLKGWFAWSVHDAVYYVVPDAYVRKFAYIMAIAHMYGYATLLQNLGINEIPTAIAFPSSIDVNQFWRKEPDYPTATPSTPEEKPAGMSLTIEDLWKIGHVLESKVDKI